MERTHLSGINIFFEPVEGNIFKQSICIVLLFYAIKKLLVQYYDHSQYNLRNLSYGSH